MRMGVCRHFLNGQCHFGARCKFEHQLSDQRQLGPRGSGGVIPMSAEKDQNVPMDGILGGPGGRSSVCRNYLAGHCAFGARCKYSHDEGLGDQPATNGNRNQSSTQKNSKESQVCRNFLQGSCAFGTRCNYRHDKGPVEDPNDDICKYFLSGNCKTSPCRYQHPTAADPPLLARAISSELDGEFPQWPLTCFGIGNQSNFVVGELSPEEVRAQAYLALRASKSRSEVVSTEVNMVVAKKQEFSSLLAQCHSTLGLFQANAFAK
mmetsp:Transcript_2571/g.4551  ORF Transcript_2571/g.4551 Transcript_2571/m.4551 type:complete len:263 (-) Transcript_2571:908-1696(-)|eukprot:CAMPEP_0184689316 /NCGR_PEP_ID=MMETSP0312-20130426/30588_1 /TAXON_ID=31354 /ORGANISM="Compsopogon coeruleus, Strain SAG 36.94" /LENGTH=262 /DNA_ID=CAMNT_0027146651 /DNA_START=477 /DNA_END=1265 /DNA_ORIENTATION=+